MFAVRPYLMLPLSCYIVHRVLPLSLIRELVDLALTYSAVLAMAAAVAVWLELTTGEMPA
jgi:hypothetical protein